MPTKRRRPFDVRAFLESKGIGERITYARGAMIFSQGDPCGTVMYLESGSVQLSVLSHEGKEAIVATLGPGEFLGEGALAGHPVRLETATATMLSAALVVPKREMIRLLGANTPSPTDSSRTSWRGTRGSRPIWSITCSTRARSGWRARCCCSPATATGTSLFTYYPWSRKRRSRRWSGQGGPA